jgi:hypothetical protein
MRETARFPVKRKRRQLARSCQSLKHLEIKTSTPNKSCLHAYTYPLAKCYRSCRALATDWNSSKKIIYSFINVFYIELKEYDCW